MTTQTGVPLEDLFETLMNLAEEEGGSGGGGIIGLTTIEVGWKVYAKGLNQADAFFPYKDMSKEAREAIKAKAQGVASNLNAPAQFGCQIRVARDGALRRGQPATWEHDRFFNADGWTSAYKQVVLPSLKAVGITTMPWTGWARIGFKPDPYKMSLGETGKTDTDQNGNPRFPLVAYVTHIYRDEAEAKADVVPDEEQPKPKEAGWQPEGAGWTRETLLESADMIAAEITGGNKDAGTVAIEYGLSVTDVLIACGVLSDTTTPLPSIAKFFGVKVADVQAARAMKNLFNGSEQPF